MNENELLAPYTTLKVGGPAKYFVEVSDEAGLAEAVATANTKGVSVRVLGGGSNVLVPDDGVEQLVIKNSIKGISVDERETEVELTAGSGEVLDDIVAHTVEKNWWGLENLSHIPGTIGATPIQNVGAYGVEVKDTIIAVRVFDIETMEFKTLSNEECNFSYRNSLFKQENAANYIITAVTVRLSKNAIPKIEYRDLADHFSGQKPTQAEIRNAVIDIRSRKFPDWNQVGTAGSFFKNPIVTNKTYQKLKSQHAGLPGFALSDGTVKLPLGWLLDKVLHLKGDRAGAVGTYEGQALVLLNHGGASAKDIETYAEKIVTEVKNTLGIKIEWEVTRW